MTATGAMLPTDHHALWGTEAACAWCRAHDSLTLTDGRFECARPNDGCRTRKRRHTTAEKGASHG